MTHDRKAALLHAALDTAARGWAVFPLRPGSKRPALHSEARCPRTGTCATGHQKWEDRATTDPDRIRRAWSTAPYNLGIATGPSGLVVVDLDMPKQNDKSKGEKGTPDGVTAFTALCERAGHAVPATRTIRTAGGGQHLYFTAPRGIRLSNTAGRLAPLVDTRAWGGYVVGVGSLTPAGAYEVTDPAPAVTLPEWVYALLAPCQSLRALTAAPSAVRASRYASAALTAETANVARAAEGTRNSTLLRAARALGRFVASGDLPRHAVEDALKGAGEAAGLRESECTPVITSALNWSITHNPQGRAA
ncbi:bifunctional DNA primase/polymerase [Streptomyces sp. NPDC055078]